MNLNDRPDKQGSPAGDPDHDAPKKRKPRMPKTGWKPPAFDAFGESDRAGRKPFSRGPKKFGDKPAFGDRKPGFGPKKPGFGPKRPFGREERGEGFGPDRERKPFGFKRDGDKPGGFRRDEGQEGGSFRPKRPFGDRKPFGRDGGKPDFAPRRRWNDEGDGRERKPFGFKPGGDRPGGFRRDEGQEGGSFRPKRPFGDRKPFGRDGGKPDFAPRRRWNDEGEDRDRRPGFGFKPGGDRPGGFRRDEGQEGGSFRPKRPFGDRKPFGRDGGKPDFAPRRRWNDEGEDRDRRPGFGFKPGGDRSGGFRRDEGQEGGSFRPKRPFGDRKPFGRDGGKPDFAPRRRWNDEGGERERKPFGFKPGGDRSGGFRRDEGQEGGSFRPKRPFGDRKPFGRDGGKPGFAPRRYERGPSQGFGAGKPTMRRPFDKDAERTSAKDRFKGFGTKKRGEDVAQPEAPSYETTGIVRLNKYISHSGICARREADDMIVAGKVSVNGQVITELGTRVKTTDAVTVNGHTISFEPFVYLLMHKPKNTITTTSDEKDRQTVMDLVAEAIPERVYPVGRLDRNTTGALLLTNDGDLANRLMHPSYTIDKVYQAEINRVLTDDELDQLRKGVELEDGPAKAYHVVRGLLDPYSIELSVHEGRNHLVRRMIEALGAEVMKLKRSRFAGLNLDDLRPGRWRFLKPVEVNTLRTKVKLPELKSNAKK